MTKKQLLIFSAVIIIVLAGYASVKFISKKPSAEILTEQPKSAAIPKLKLVLMQESEDINFLADFTKDKGYFKRNGLEVEFVFADKDPAGLVVGGQADVVLSGLYRPVALYYNNAGVRLIFNTVRPLSFFGVSRFPKEKISEVKKAAINSFGGESQIVVESALKIFGVDPEKVEFVALPSNIARLSQLKKKEVDFMLVTSEKFIYENNLKKDYSVYEPGEIIKGDMLTRSAVTTDKIIKEKPEELMKFTRSFMGALKEMENDKAGVINYVKEKYGLSDERAEDFYSRLAAAKNGLSFEPRVEYLTGLAEAVKKESGVVSGRDLKDFIYPDFAREAVKTSEK